MTIQVAPDDCTGCGICVDVCPAHDKSEVKHRAINMEPKEDHLERERANWDFFRSIADPARGDVRADTVKGSQQLRPLFEFSGACAGCGETPYLKLLTQLFGDRMLVANATGCSSIYGGNLPTTPWSVDADGPRARVGELAVRGQRRVRAGDPAGRSTRNVTSRSRCCTRCNDELGPDLVAGAIAGAAEHGEAATVAQRDRVADVAGGRWPRSTTRARARWRRRSTRSCPKSVWIVGGDGWAYDIGFGGLDHVLSSGHDVNVLVLDTEVYSNTGGQASKATPRGAVAKFAAAGKGQGKKDLGLLAIGLRRRLRRADRDGRRHAAHGQGARRGRGAPGPVARDRLLDVHRARDRHVDQHVPPEGSGRRRLLAAVSLRSAAARTDPRGSSTARRRPSPSRSSRRRRRASRCWRVRIPSEPRRSWTTAQSDIWTRRRRYEQLAGIEPHGGGPVMTVDLHTRYLGLELRSPIVASASPMGQKIDTLRRMQDAGVGAVVLPSLFEEQVEHEELQLHGVLGPRGRFATRRRLSYLPELEDYNTGADAYVRHLEACASELEIPVIASPERHHGRQLDRTGQAAAGRRRRRARAERVLHRRRSG